MLLPSLLPCDGISRPVSSPVAPLTVPQDLFIRHAMDDTLTSSHALQAMLGAPSSSLFYSMTWSRRPTLTRSTTPMALNRDETAAPPQSQVKDRNHTALLQLGRKHMRDDSAAPVECISLQHERSFSTASTLASGSPVLKESPLQTAILSPMLDVENPDMTSTPTAQDPRDSDTPYSTPKRRRIAPLSMPLGLSVSDFEALNMPPGYGPRPDEPPNSTQLEQQSLRETSESVADNVVQERESENDLYWDSSDDLALVSILLEKFRLSKRDWNECARILGKDKDSLSRRWRYLIGNGNIGLRRSNEKGRGRLNALHGDVNGFECP